MKTTYSNPAPDDEDDLAGEYAFDYTKAKPNRFAIQDSPKIVTVIVSDKDIAQKFPRAKGVNLDVTFEVKISHPYFDRVVHDDDGYHVYLREDFSVETFLVMPDTPIWDGYIEMTSDIGFVHEDGNVDWIHGSGQNEVDAVESACQMFLNLVVASDGLRNSDFVRRLLY